MTAPRPNYRKTWQTCPNCLLDWMGVDGGLCPNCLSLSMVIVSPRLVSWLLIAVVTLVALAITGIGYVVSR